MGKSDIFYMYHLRSEITRDTLLLIIFQHYHPGIINVVCNANSPSIFLLLFSCKYSTTTVAPPYHREKQI